MEFSEFVSCYDDNTRIQVILKHKKADALAQVFKGKLYDLKKSKAFVSIKGHKIVDVFVTDIIAKALERFVTEPQGYTHIIIEKGVE